MPFRALFRRQPRPPETQTITVAFDGEFYAVAIRRHRQARRYTLRIHAAAREAVMTMPWRGSVADAKVFAQKHGAWIAARLQRLPQGISFRDGAVIPFRGEPHRIVHRPGMRGTVSVEADDEEKRLCVSGDGPHLHRRVADFLKRQARRDLDAASRRAAEKLGVAIKRVSVRDQTSRWGSCSNAGMLSYSWRLIMAPPFVLDYLAAHEVAHLVEMNHSRAFWRVVDKLCPDVERAKSWLNAHGGDLHRYGAQATGDLSSESTSRAFG
ncbi:MAG: M48 family metallopeptidase [Pseudorhodoplanes sp.]